MQLLKSPKFHAFLSTLIGSDDISAVYGSPKISAKNFLRALMPTFKLDVHW